jgi:hypothetical protein
VGASLAGRLRGAGLLGVLGLLLVNLAGLITGQYGADGMGLLGTLLVTSPVAVVFAYRETVWRREKRATSTVGAR